MHSISLHGSEEYYKFHLGFILLPPSSLVMASGVIPALPYKTVNAFLSPGLTHTTQTPGQD